MKRKKTSTHKTEQKRRTLAEASTGSVVAHRSRMGVRFYLHEGKTKTGKQRYFVAKEIGPGALARLPAGFEVCESINGVVSVRRIRLDWGDISERDLALVRQAVEGCQHLQHYQVRAADSAIVIYEPDPRVEQLQDISRLIGLGGLRADYIAERIAHARYSPVMKFEAEPGGNTYAVFRMTYRGHGGWSYPLKSGKLASLVRHFVQSVGTEGFFDLM